MIELERHIEILLLSNDCVIVPDLGGFMTHHVSARYDDSDGFFLPPLRTLGFNPQLTMNDSLLVQSYVEAYDISYPEALRRIESEVAELRQHLANEGEYELNDIGVLRMNEEGHMEFEPCEAGILTPQLYGLSSFEMKPVELPAAEPASAEEAGTKAPAAKEEHAIVIKLSWLRNAAAIAAAIIAFFLVQTPVSNSNTVADVQQSAILPITGKKLSIANAEADVVPVQEPAEAATAAQPKETAEASGKEPATEEAPVTETEAKAVPEKNYCIVLASQTTPKLAEEFVTQIQNNGFKEAHIIDMQNKKNRVRVVYGAYATEEEAMVQLRQMRQHKEFQEAWILHL